MPASTTTKFSPATAWCRARASPVSGVADEDPPGLQDDRRPQVADHADQRLSKLQRQGRRFVVVSDAQTAADVDVTDIDALFAQLPNQATVRVKESTKGWILVIWEPMCWWMPTTSRAGSFLATSYSSRARPISIPNLLCFNPVAM